MANLLSMVFSGVGSVGRGVWKLGTSGIAGRAALGSMVGAGAGAFSGWDTTSKIEGAGKGALLGAIGGVGISVMPSLIRRGATTGWRGSKSLWAANMASGRARAMKNARLTELGAGVAGPLPKGAMPGTMGGLAASPMTRTAAMPAQVAMFAANHPFVTAGVVGAVGAVSAFRGWQEHQGSIQTTESPTQQGMRMNVNYNQQAIMAAELGQIGGGVIGPAPEMMPRFEHANWMQSVGRMMASNTRTGQFMNSTVGLPQGLSARRHG